MNYKILLITFQIVKFKTTTTKTVQPDCTFKWNFDSEIIFINQIEKKK